MNRLKVTHVVPHLRHGGAERMAVDLMTGLNHAKYDVSALILGTRVGTALERELDERGVSSIYLDKGPGFHPNTFLKVHRALCALEPDIMHTHVHVLRYVLPAKVGCSPSLHLHTVHNIAEREVEPRAQWIQKLAFLSGVVPVAVSTEVAHSLDRTYKLRQSRVILNCIPVQKYANPVISRSVWREREGIPSNAVLFTCVALLREQKNHQMLLESFAIGPARDPRARLLLAGAGPLEATIKAQARSIGVTGRVHFLGMRDDIADLLNASDVFVLSSDYEGNPLAVMEAMASGLPVISTKAGGVPELVSSGRDGLLLDCGDREALSKAMVYLLCDETARVAMGKAAIQKARTKFDLALMVTAYESLYETLRPIARKDAILVSSM